VYGGREGKGERAGKRRRRIGRSEGGVEEEVAGKGMNWGDRRVEGENSEEKEKMREKNERGQGREEAESQGVGRKKGTGDRGEGRGEEKGGE